LLDLEQRNQAIEIIWLKKYLNFGEDRPQWALVLDETMKLRVPITEKGTPMEVRVNVFLQTWKTHTHAIRTSKTIRSLIKTAKVFNVRPEGLIISPEIQREMPLWLHREADPKIKKLMNSQPGKC